ncbi:hypothetical protein [Planctomicrobium sp. SH664]|uniref:hypothetical protein n=1 Tax=Planctomicrobium sp. SH664 TaxID=3448125 RepID=UPI003F5C2568
MPNTLNLVVLYVYFSTVFLQSMYVGGVPVSVLSFPLVFVLLGLNLQYRRITLIAMALLAIMSLLLLFTTNSRIPFRETLKAAIGIISFFTTLFGLPVILRLYPDQVKRLTQIWIVIFAAFFFLEFAGVLSLRELGITRGWSRYEISQIENPHDLRSAGMFSEPSWLCLAMAPLVWIESVFAGRFTWVGVLGLITMLFSGSSIGLVLASTLAIITFLSSIRRLSLTTVVSGITGLLGLLIGLVYMQKNDPERVEQVFAKVLDPISSQSGYIRFFTPLRPAQMVAQESPLTGLGMSSISEGMLGGIGTAVLPINVFIEMGALGLLIYSISIIGLAISERTTLGGIVLTVLTLLTLGLSGSPFQAAMIAIYITVTPALRQWATETHGGPFLGT